MIGPVLGRALWIMGRENGIHPHEVAEATGKPFTPRQMEFLERVPFPEDVLRECRGEYALFPGQLLPLSEVHRVFGYSVHGQWWANDHQSSWVDLRWYLIRMGAHQGSSFHSWDEQVALLGDGQVVPSVSSVVFAHYLFKRTGRGRIVMSSARCRGGRFCVMPSPHGVGIHDEGKTAGIPGVMVERKPINASAL